MQLNSTSRWPPPCVQLQTMTVKNQPTGSTTYYTTFIEKYINLIITNACGTHMPFFLQTYYNNSTAYDRLLQQWISWALSNNISCGSLHNLPGARDYIASIEQGENAAHKQCNPLSVKAPSHSSLPGVVPTSGRDIFWRFRKHFL